jgi:hypothetical protein
MGVSKFIMREFAVNLRKEREQGAGIREESNFTILNNKE